MSNERPIVIKKVKKVSGGGHHGGAWKVAYADFTTAMMAYFMLLWLLNVSDEVTLQGLADYFTPTNASMSNSSGAGGILAGTNIESTGASNSGSATISFDAPQQVSNTTMDASAESGESYRQGIAEERAAQDWDAKIVTREDKMFGTVQQALKTAIQESETLQRHQDQIIVEQTPEGLRIQLIDKDQRSMFMRGSAQLYPFATERLSMVGRVIQGLPNRIAISGHTDSSPAARADYSNWELSADRANAARRVIRTAKVRPDRFSEVTGMAATEPLFPDEPLRPENIRVTLLLLREAPVLAPDFGQN
ncbi:MAG: flagellar motor protein MotB [Sphingomonadales bacterium]